MQFLLKFSLLITVRKYNYSFMTSKQTSEGNNTNLVLRFGHAMVI